MRFWMHQAAFATAWILIFATLAAAQQQTLNDVPAEMVSYPDLIVHNGKIVSMDDPGFNSDPGSIYQAMAIRGNRIQFLGSNDQILRYAGPGTRRIDLQGRTVVPGLWDTHNHLHNASVTQWIRRNPEKVETIAKRFAVTGKTYEELTRGIELVVKEQMARHRAGRQGADGAPSAGSVGHDQPAVQQSGHRDRGPLSAGGTHGPHDAGRACPGAPGSSE